MDIFKLEVAYICFDIFLLQNLWCQVKLNVAICGVMLSYYMWNMD